MSASPTPSDVRPSSDVRRSRDPIREGPVSRRSPGPNVDWKGFVRKFALGMGLVAVALARAASDLADQTRQDRAVTEPEPVDYISREEGVEILNQAARQNLDMTADEFVKLWDAGEIENPDRPEVMRVAMLLPLGR